MSENKTYYWLKLNEDFFDDETMQYIREQENGDKYLIIYLILCVKSLRTDGMIIRIVGNTLLPYKASSLAKLTGSDVDTVRTAVNLFKAIGLVDILDNGAIQMAQIKELAGKETDAARRKRKSRALRAAKEKSLESPEIPTLEDGCDNVTDVSQVSHENVTQSIESRDKSLDIREKRIESKREKEKDGTVTTGTYGNVMLSPEEYDEIKNEYPFTYIEQINRLSEQKKIHGYKFKSDYAVLRKWQREDDWDYKEESEEYEVYLSKKSL